jgi:hypothetical protein
LVLLVRLHVVVCTLCYREDVGGHLETVLALVSGDDFVRVDSQIYPRAHTHTQLSSALVAYDQVRTSERIDGYQNRADISVYLRIRPAFLEIIVDGLVTDGGEESHIGHADLFLLETLFPICL